MKQKVLSSPTNDDLIEFVSQGHKAGRLISIQATCSAKFTGHREGVIGIGDRIILCKTDGAVAVHRPTKARAVARQGIGSSIEIFKDEDSVVIYSSKGDSESIRIDVFDVFLASQFAASDHAVLIKDQTEKQMHKHIKSDPEAIEDGLRIIEHEYSTPVGRVDFYAADSEGNSVILEIKQPKAEFPDIDQLQRYVSHFQESTQSSVRGILVAPFVGKRIKRILRSKGLEWVQFEEYDNRGDHPKQTSMDEW